MPLIFGYVYITVSYSYFFIHKIVCKSTIIDICDKEWINNIRNIISYVRTLCVITIKLFLKFIDGFDDNINTLFGLIFADHQRRG